MGGGITAVVVVAVPGRPDEWQTTAAGGAGSEPPFGETGSSGCLSTTGFSTPQSSPMAQGPGKVAMVCNLGTWSRSAAVGGSMTGMTGSEDHRGSYAMVIYPRGLLHR
jgi:hypothetical protein